MMSVNIPAFNVIEPSEREAKYAQIIADIGIHEDAIRALKRDQNSLNIAVLVPPEVLSTIFQYIIELEQDSLLSRISISHVCQRWRRVSLDSKTLWSRIPFNRPKWVAELLSRSGSTLLDVYFEDGLRVKDAAKALQATLGESHRVRDLSISSLQTTPKRLKAITSILSQPFPVIENFLACIEKDSGLIIPKNLFSGEAPKLQTLDLYGCPISQNLPFFSNLTTFKLRYDRRFYRDIHSKAPCADDLIFALDSMPLLETLVLCNTHEYGLTFFFGRNTAHLPNLRCLDFDDSHYIYEYLVPRLVYPETTLQKFTISGVHGQGTDSEEAIKKSLPQLRRISQMLAKKIPVGQCLEIRKDNLTLHATIWNRAGTALTSPPEPSNLQINLSEPMDPDRLPHSFDQLNLLALSALWSALPLAQVESLHVIEVQPSTEMWLNFGKKLKLLRNIRLVGRSGYEEFRKALQSGTGEAYHRDVTTHMKPSRLLFKSLIHLTVERRRTVYHEDLNLIYSALLKRRKRGSALRRLSFVRAEFGTFWYKQFERDIDRFAAVVPQVYWDVRDGSFVSNGAVGNTAKKAKKKAKIEGEEN